MASRPNILPLIDTTQSNLIDWEASPLRFTGFQPGQVVPSAPHNTMGLLSALWAGYLDYGTVRAGDYLSPTTQRWSSTRLAYTLGQEVITIGASVSTYATYFVGGYRIEIDQGLLQPFGAFPLLQPGATLPGRIWLYLDYGIISDPAQPIAAIRVGLAGVGAAATPSVSEIALVGVDVNALGVVTGNAYDGSDPARELVYGAMPQTWLGPVTFDTILVTGAATLSAGLDMDSSSIANVDALGCATIATTGSVSIGGGLDMTSGAISNATTIAASSSVGTITGASSSNTAGGIVGTNSAAGPAVIGTGTTGVGGSFFGGGSSAGVTGLGGATAGAGLAGTSQGGSSPGVAGTGANAANCHGVQGTAVDTSSYGIAGTSAAAATSSGAGVRANGLGDAPAVWAVSTNGVAGLFTSDTSAPTRAALRITPQDADPTTAAVGDVLINSARLNKPRHHDGTKYLSVHSSVNGSVTAFAAGTSGTTLNSGDLATVTITPEVAGDVLITATGLIEQAGDGDSCSILLRDATLGSTIQTTVERQIDTDAVGVRTRSFVARAVYTLPNASARSFAFQINGNAAVNVTRSACVLSVMGVQ